MIHIFYPIPSQPGTSKIIDHEVAVRGANHRQSVWRHEVTVPVAIQNGRRSLPRRHGPDNSATRTLTGDRRVVNCSRVATTEIMIGNRGMTDNGDSPWRDNSSQQLEVGLARKRRLRPVENLQSRTRRPESGGERKRRSRSRSGTRRKSRRRRERAPMTVRPVKTRMMRGGIGRRARRTRRSIRKPSEQQE